MIDAFFTGMDASMNNLLGSETVKLRRSLRLTSKDAPSAADLRASAGVGTGATSIRLKSAAGALQGYIGEGLTLTIGALAYRVTADSQWNQDGTVLVGFEPPLILPVLADDHVLVSETLEWDLPNSLVYMPRNTVVPGDLVSGVSFAVSVPTATAPIVPRTNDVATGSLGTGVVLAFLPSDGGSWELLAGRAGSPAIESSKRQMPPRSFA